MSLLQSSCPLQRQSLRYSSDMESTVDLIVPLDHDRGDQFENLRNSRKAALQHRTCRSDAVSGAPRIRLAIIHGPVTHQLLTQSIVRE